MRGRGERNVGAPVFTANPERERMMVRNRFRILTASTLIAAAFALSACGTDPSDRAVSGGLLGAGAGAAIGSLAGSAGAGAIIGGVGGAAVGALSDPCSLDLGDPFWRDHGGQRGYHERCDRR
jgi:hypothetical protein